MLTQDRIQIPNTDSRFGWITAGLSSGPHHVFDRVLAENDGAVAIPSTGSLLPGWTLVVPREQALSLRDASANTQAKVQALRDEAIRTLSASFPEPIFVFEHGPSNRGSLTGCGVDQAHLHIVPLPFDLIEAASKRSHTERLSHSSDLWNELRVGVDYYLLSHPRSERALAIYPEAPVSQAIRRLIASEIGLPDQWNYRQDPFEENAAQTIAAFGLD